MSPRRNRPKGTRREQEPERALVPEIVTAAPPGWQARAIPATGAAKRYRCPGCDQEILPATAHVVAWRRGEEAERRHWHAPCWERERRRMPRA